MGWKQAPRTEMGWSQMFLLGKGMDSEGRVLRHSWDTVQGWLIGEHPVSEGLRCVLRKVYFGIRGGAIDEVSIFPRCMRDTDLHMEATAMPLRSGTLHAKSLKCSYVGYIWRGKQKEIRPSLEDWPFNPGPKGSHKEGSKEYHHHRTESSHRDICCHEKWSHTMHPMVVLVDTLEWDYQVPSVKCVKHTLKR